MEKNVRIDISAWAVAKIILVLMGFYFLFLIRDILTLLFIVLILVATFNPVINSWSRRIGRAPAVIILFAIIFAVFAGLILLIVPPVVSQLSQLAGQYPQFLTQFEGLESLAPVLQRNIDAISQGLANFTTSFLNITANVFGGLTTFLIVVILTAYMLIDKESFTKFAISLFPSDHKNRIVRLFNKIGQKLGAWFRGEMALGFIIGAISWVGLMILQVPYALTLAVIAGLLELVPTVGPIIAGIIAASIAFFDSPIKGISVIILYIIIQQLENAFIVPKVMQKAVGLSPVIIIFAILIGAKLLGIAGAILAVPLAASISVIVQEWSMVRDTIKDQEDKIEAHEE